MVLSTSAASSTRGQVIPQLADEPLKLEQVDGVLFVHADRVAGRVHWRKGALVR